MGSWVEVGDRVFVRRYTFYDQNIGVVLDGDDVLLIDTRSTHVHAREVAADLRELTAAPVTIVVNTHGHFDHAYGNRVFRPAPIWGHEGCVTFMTRTGELRRARIALEEPEIAGDLAEVVIDPPDRTFAETAYLEVGGRRVELRYLGRGHTDHDIVVRVPDAAVVFAGDLLENGAVPFFGDAYPLDWPETAFRVAELVSNVVVPGHGDHAGPSFADAQPVALAGIAALARQITAGHMTIEDALAATPFPEHPADDVRLPLQRAIAQLRGEIS
ncbi:MAG: MBL fold metallo-hydrolase [Chloroflexi bacterium]|nr:MBL fold metallo-hydrolase [Chloroflexota bacterium]